MAKSNAVCSPSLNGVEMSVGKNLRPRSVDRLAAER